MLAQWVPLHAVSCSNLIETGGCAESREIPLRVTQTCSGCCSLSRLSSYRMRIARVIVRGPFTSRRADTPLFHTRVPGPGQRSRSLLRIPRTRSRSRLRIAILGMPAFFRANFQPREFADDRLIECRR